MEKSEFINLYKNQKAINRSSVSYRAENPIMPLNEIYTTLINSYHPNLSKYENGKDLFVPINDIIESFPSFDQAVLEIEQLITKCISDDTYSMSYKLEMYIPYRKMIGINIKNYFNFFREYDINYMCNVNDNSGYKMTMDTYKFNHNIFNCLVDMLIYATIKEKFPFLVYNEGFVHEGEGVGSKNYGIICELKDD